jgi:hypothetical protein
MGARNRIRLLAFAAACVLLAGPAVADPPGRGQRAWSLDGRRGGREDRPGRLPRGYQEPAFERGYTDGYAKGIADGRDRDGYDPVRHKDYRQADQGYFASYGSRDAYRNNYRAGFRQGYEEGYRRTTR